jgi:putative membrane protein
MARRRNDTDLVRLALLALTILVLGPMVVMVIAFPLMGMYGGGMGMWGGGHVWGDQAGMGGAVWALLTSLLWLAVLSVIGYLLYRWSASRHPGAADPAIDELRMAYARGELTDEEFEDRREALRADARE